MYEEYFNLKGNPFNLTPSLEFYYPSPAHKKVLAYLEYGVERADGFIVVTGNVGAGKTTIIQTLLNELEGNSDILVVQLISTQLDDGDLLRIIASSLGMESDGLSKAALLYNLEDFLRKKETEGKRVLLIVDEAQNMPKRSLEELRMLSNYQENGRPLFQSFLIGQEQFRSIINQNDMQQLKQRVIASYHLDTLDNKETKRYIEYRLECTGWKRDPDFDTQACNKIFEYTEGVPRRINVFCERLLLRAALEEIHHITGTVVDDVIAEFAEESKQSSPRSKNSEKRNRKDKKANISQAKETVTHVDLEQRIICLEDKITRLEASIEKLISHFEL